jgi:hypothetical protein
VEVVSAPRTRQEVERLLGPVDQEVSCERCFELLDEYAEANLAGDAAAAMPQMRAHLEGCPACREEVESLVALISSEGREGA